jgi:hypothetical protein
MKMEVVILILMTATPHLTARAAIHTVVMLRRRRSLCVRALLTPVMMVLRMESTSHSFSLARGRTRMQMAGKTATCLAQGGWLSVNSVDSPRLQRAARPP